MTDINSLGAGDEVIIGRGRNSGQRVKILSVGTDTFAVTLPNGEPAVITKTNDRAPAPLPEGAPAVITKTNGRVPDEATVPVSAIIGALAGIDSDKLSYGPLVSLLSALDSAAP